MIEKGLISTVSADGKTAFAVPSFSDAPVSAALTVPFYLVGSLTAGVAVAYAQFDDNTGVILARMDGDWSHNLDGDIKITGDLQTTTVPSYNSHTHDTPSGASGAPR